MRTRPAPPRVLEIAAGVVVTAFFIAAIENHLDLGRLRVSLAQVHGDMIALALVCLVGGFGAKIWRWRTMLAPLSPGVSFTTAGQTLMGSVALNNVLPLRAGDVARAVAFRDELGVGPTVLAGLLVLERLLDLGMLIALAAMIAVAMEMTGWPPSAYYALHWLGVGGLLALGVLIVLVRPLARRAIDRRARAGRLDRVLALGGTALEVIAAQMKGAQATRR